MAGSMMRMAKGSAIIAFTRAVIGRASLNGLINGKIMMNRPVPMTKGEATSDRKLMPSIRYAARRARFVRRTINDERIKVRPMHIVADVREITVELMLAEITLAGSFGRCWMPLSRIAANGINRKRPVRINRVISLYL